MCKHELEEHNLFEKTKKFHKEVKESPDKSITFTVKSRQGKIIGYETIINEPG